MILAFSRFGNEIQQAFASESMVGSWAAGGTVYAGYNLIGAVVILPVMRHLTSNRDAVIAGLLSGPLAMLPGALFFICMVAFLPDIASATLPSDFMLQRLEMPLFHLPLRRRQLEYVRLLRRPGEPADRGRVREAGSSGR